ncbi:UNVERIFIED_CONTAM: Dihydrofolate reductase [Sesamum calycinum]|uniref:Dihydrofolate reductase n=1 Tax=Sesamum calycinum TaxID=2727403 RepID=A0AAW2N4H2_9LAMI
MKGGDGAKMMRILCLHGFRTSGSFLRKQISKWDPSIFAHFDMDFTEYTNLEECIAYLCEYITSKGPFDGLLGFSQGATLSALLLGYQAQGKILKEHPPLKLFVSISGSKFREPSICEVAYKDPIRVKSVHFIGDKDWLKLPSEELATAFVNPLVIRHPQGHTVPRLDEEAVCKLSNWAMEIILSQRSTNAAPVDTVDETATNKEEEAEPKEESECEIAAAAEGNGIVLQRREAKAVEAVNA